MTKMNPSRSRLSAPLASALSTLASQGKTIFTAEDFAKTISRPEERIYRILSKLASGGWITRLVKGKYLIVPLEAGPEGAWTEDALVIASNLADPAAVAYWSACHYWNWTEQVPRTVFAQSTWRVRPRVQTVLGVTYRFIRLQPGKFFGTLERTAGQGRFTVTDREKTLVDALDRPDLCGGTRQVAEMLPAMEAINWDKVEAYIDRMGSGAIYKRLGFLVEMLGGEVKVPKRKRRLETWRRKLTGGYAPLEPGGPRPGSVNNRWLVRVNVPGLIGRETR